MNLKHVGRVVATERKCLVAYKTLPGDAYNCLVISTENLPDEYHDALINLVESPSGQSVDEFAHVLERTQFPDGSSMLARLHATGRLVKVATDAIEMIPNTNTKILLSELNQILAESRGIPVDELAIKPDHDEDAESKVVKVADLEIVDAKVDHIATEASALADQSLPPEEKAKQYRSMASKLFRQAAEYRRLAEELAPSARRAGSKTKSS